MIPTITSTMAQFYCESIHYIVIGGQNHQSFLKTAVDYPSVHSSSEFTLAPTCNCLLSLPTLTFTFEY